MMVIHRCQLSLVGIHQLCRPLPEPTSDSIFPINPVTPSKATGQVGGMRPLTGLSA